jgi:hypothetical protein
MWLCASVSTMAPVGMPALVQALQRARQAAFLQIASTLVHGSAARM